MKKRHFVLRLLSDNTFAIFYPSSLHIRKMVRLVFTGVNIYGILQVGKTELGEVPGYMRLEY